MPHYSIFIIFECVCASICLCSVAVASLEKVSLSWRITVLFIRLHECWTCLNLNYTAIRVLLRGKAHNEWKVMVSGDRRTVSDDQYFIDDRATIWGKGNLTSTKLSLTSYLVRWLDQWKLSSESETVQYTLIVVLT